MTETKENGTIKWIKEEVKLVYISVYLTALIVGGGLLNYYSMKGIVENHGYRITQIEQARAEVWEEQRELNRTIADCISDLRLTDAELKAKIK